MFLHVAQTHNVESIVINDANSSLINVYKNIRDNVCKLIEKLAALQTQFLAKDSEQRSHFFYDMRQKFNQNLNLTIEKAIQFIFLNKTCFNGLFRVNKKGEFNVPVGKYSNPLLFDESNLLSLSKILQNVEIRNGDFAISNNWGEETLVYLDPPYKEVSKTANFSSYTSNGFSDEEQIRVKQYCDRLNKAGVSFMVSNSDDQFIHELYKEYSIHLIDAPRNINSDRDKRGCVKEVLVTNNLV